MLSSKKRDLIPTNICTVCTGRRGDKIYTNTIARFKPHFTAIPGIHSRHKTLSLRRAFAAESPRSPNLVRHCSPHRLAAINHPLLHLLTAPRNPSPLHVLLPLAFPRSQVGIRAAKKGKSEKTLPFDRRVNRRLISADVLAKVWWKSTERVLSP